MYKEYNIAKDMEYNSYYWNDYYNIKKHFHLYLLHY